MTQTVIIPGDSVGDQGLSVPNISTSEIRQCKLGMT